VILNVYEKFFNSVSVAYVKQHLFATIIFFIGWAAGLVGVSRIIMFLFDNHSQIISFCFIGLILGCLPMIYKKAAADRIKFKNAGLFFIALALMIFLAFIGGDISTNSTVEQLGGITPGLLAWVFFASFVSSMAMLIPGVGGSLVMLIFGIYTIYIEAISTFNPVLLIVFLVSMILGILAGIVLTKKMLASYSQTLYFAILGFIVGSLFIIYPGFSVDINGLLSVIFASLFAVLAYWLSKKA
jgi:putative membrane protein